MTVRVATRAAKAVLLAAEVPDAAFDAVQLVRLVTGQEPRICPPEAELTQAQQTRLDALVQRRAAREPLQYLCGSWDFLDFTLTVGEGVLIPRADTEVVCESAIAAAHAAAARTGRPPVVADLCSGTGAIAIGLARALGHARVCAVELSPRAFDYLVRNTRALAPQVECVQADVFLWQAQCAPQSFDVIVSNPPYISAAELETLAPELAFEPRMALEAAENGLAFYRHICTAYRSALRVGGQLVLEIGAAQGDAVCALLAAAGYANIQLLQDLGGNPRCVTAVRGAQEA